YCRCSLEVSAQTLPRGSTSRGPEPHTYPVQHMADLRQEAGRLLQQSLSTNTWATYQTGINALHQFRSAHQLQEVWPVPLDQVVNFIAYLSVTHHSPNTVKTYIAALSSHHKFHGLTDCTNHFLIGKIVTGLHKSAGRPDTRKPITADLLQVVTNNLPHVCSSAYEARLFKAVYCTAFFGFFRVSELVQTGPSKTGCAIQNLSFSGNPQQLSIHLPHSKSDQYRMGTTVTMSPIPGNPLCPVVAIKHYLEARPSGPQHAFVHFDHSPVTRYQFQALLKKALAHSNINTACYSSHSFRIGAATSAAMNGVPEHLIQQYGRWKSDCYNAYIRLPTNSMLHN
ncbi:integrase/recombinase xerD homolog, partial [Haliotis cracherodii]|uniref:integrase/recombinase xerD homolog n=1 Tax=Haliotis cracherodii TaxID=6455 RepID=UPI0039EC1CBD